MSYRYILNSKFLIMKKLFLIALIAALSSGAFAQTTPTTKEEKKELKQDARDIKKDRKEMKEDIKNENTADADKIRHDIRADRKDMRRDAKQLGIKHPRRHIRRHH